MAYMQSSRKTVATTISTQMQAPLEKQLFTKNFEDVRPITIVPQKPQPSNSFATDLAKCIPSWKQIFPWLHYEEKTLMFTCLLCEWGSMDPNLIKVFQVTSLKDVHLVAKKLRKHKESPGHQKISQKRQTLSDLCKYMYPLLKTFSQDTTSLEDIIKTVTDLAGGSFPGPEDTNSKFAFAGYMSKRIAECIEEDLLNSLSESPCFSIVALENYDYIILRWINSKGESEEHLLCSQIGFPGQGISCITYLENRSIDMSKLVSYTVLPKSSESETNQKMSSIISSPVRCPDFELFVNWVEEASFLKELFEHLNVLTRLCKTYFHKFAGFTEAYDLMSIEEPFSHNCVLDEKILTFFFDNISSLKDIAADIHKKLRNMDAYGFSSVELRNTTEMARCALLFPKLHVIMQSLFVDHNQASRKALENFNDDISLRMRDLEDDSDEYVLLSLFNIFVSHVLVTIPSAEINVTDVLAKKMDDITKDDVNVLLPNLLREYKHIGSEQLFNDFKTLQSCIAKQDCFSMHDALETLYETPQLQTKFPHLCLLSKKVKVLPCFPAHKEQSLFNVTSLQVFLCRRVANHLKHPITIIILEGPSCDQISVDQVLEMWSRKWKTGLPSKADFSVMEDLVYKI
ncbi:uncharacterized protein [Palaemon carinicauda]|uniref:uncharacterized protein n=1 Tax=Palaemon carinicauda TaxID=392227 RepID=UPI0035B58FBB